jgi:hypothetical protein
MKFFRLAGMLLAVNTVVSVNARATPAVASPIGVRHGNTEYQVSCREEINCDAAVLNVCSKGHNVTVWRSPLSFDFVCKWDKPPKQQAIQAFISPDCKDSYYGPDFVDLDSSGKPIKEKPRPKPDHVLWDPANAVPMSYKDTRTSIVIHVESDGRHLTATNAQGKLLWARNPWEESHLCPYRTPRPVVFSLKSDELNDLGRSNLKSRGANVEHIFVELTFDSSQFGSLDESTGDFFPEGQN